ncbi:VanZ family protein [Bacillus sp. AGMB 02131]|uniref:VanZ family protein n=1 Tax=Peribacillus faecalis TaxID=2772559 RepID=A0A927D269_9BACI|nr:VanZ family protein [Peribacillus faecalis]MBD3110200.1 VanZ family protein [Peribacillus faecalis]
MRRFIYYVLWALPIAYMIAIWIMSSLPSNAIVELPDSKTDAFIKESLHLVEFAILYILFVIPLTIGGKLTLKSSLVFALISAAYGVTDEIHQSFVPYRSATLIDVVKDWIGVAAAWGHVRYHYFYKQQSILNRLSGQKKSTVSEKAGS